jgi:hypothetical protein
MKIPVLTLLILFINLTMTFKVTAGEWSGYVDVEGRFFPNSVLYPGQDDHTISLAAQPEYYHKWDGGSSFAFVPFLRLDSADSERTHFDIRELTFLWLHENLELRLGVRKLFWGTTETQHLVDIINQTDLVENPDTEDKLGQPMVNLSLAEGWGTLDLFVLPYFRERTFPGRNGRLRTALVVDTDKARYESSMKEWHPDLAIRYAHTIGGMDFGLYHFMGTGREPTLLEAKDNEGNSNLIPFYEQINQTGIDMSYVTGDWVWNFEAIHRSGQGESFFAWSGGVEYTFVNVAQTGVDLGIISEWLYDDRAERATTPFENDVMVGARLAVNDVASTEAIFGLVQDVNSNSRALYLEASRRIRKNWKASLEARTFSGHSTDDFFFDQRDDDYVQVGLGYYF